jgi:hypothetical protein
MNQVSVRCGYPTTRKPDPETLKVSKETWFARHLQRYMIDKTPSNSPVRRKSARRIKPGALMQLHATKGWRYV